MPYALVCAGVWDSLFSSPSLPAQSNETIHVFSIASGSSFCSFHFRYHTPFTFTFSSGHLYERFLKIMMLRFAVFSMLAPPRLYANSKFCFCSVSRATKNPCKFWFVANFLSPQFKTFAPIMVLSSLCF